MALLAQPSIIGISLRIPLKATQNLIQIKRLLAYC